MALDGITISNIIYELKNNVLNGRIDKIYQPEKDEIILSVRCFKNAFKILLTANPSNPRLHFTESTKQNPLTPPLFCMVLRKHLLSGKILDITQPNFERIVNIKIESINEMGDYSIKTLILEIMGRHSNLILTDEDGTILDSAKHITHETSSVREILPGKKYEFPPSKDKQNTLLLNEKDFLLSAKEKGSVKVQSLIYQTYNGISPVFASEICFKAGVDCDRMTQTLTEAELKCVYKSFKETVDLVKKGAFAPELIYNNDKVSDFSSLPMQQFSAYKKKHFDSISKLLEFYYLERDFIYRMGQKTADLKKLVQQNIERCIKKREIQTSTLKEISGREKLKLYGELITANIYSIKKGMTTFTTQNFYDESLKDITIPLDGNLTPAENAQKYFKRYNKEKRTFAAMQTQIIQNDAELKYLESVLASIQSSNCEQDIKEIRQELFEQGFIKKHKNTKGKQQNKKSKPLHFISSDGFDIYVGKNNKQNDELTLKLARSNDIWLHTKEIPGSHVIISTQGKEVPTETLNEAVMLSAYYSKGKNSSLVPVDYTLKKYVKKPSGAKPGMVIYETNQTAYVTPSEEKINKIQKANDTE